jgi:hypothetical protein
MVGKESNFQAKITFPLTKLDQEFDQLLRIGNNAVALTHESLATLFNMAIREEKMTRANSENPKDVIHQLKQIPNNWTITYTLLKYLSDDTVIHSIKATLEKP